MLPFRNQISERFAKLQYIFTYDKNKEIQFNSGEKKSKCFKLSDWFIFEMSRRIRKNKTSQQIKEEQINFLLEDVEKNLDECKKAVELKDKQLSDAKKILITAKTSYDKVVAWNKELKTCIENIKQRFNNYQQQQPTQYIEREKDYYTQNQPKKNKKVV